MCVCMCNVRYNLYTCYVVLFMCSKPQKAPGFSNSFQPCKEIKENHHEENHIWYINTSGASRGDSRRFQSTPCGML